MTTPHLTDDDLSGLVLELGSTPAAATHLRACATCEARRQALAGLLREIHDTVDLDTDERFPAAHLAQQRARLLRRLEQEGRPGRVLAFPATRQDRRVFRARPATRWIAAAAAAGMAVGLVVGRLSSGPGPRPAAATRVAFVGGATASVTGGFAPATVVLSDDELMGEIELAVNRPWSGLEPIHELTPP